MKGHQTRKCVILHHPSHCVWGTESHAQDMSLLCFLVVTDDKGILHVQPHIDTSGEQEMVKGTY